MSPVFLVLVGILILWLVVTGRFAGVVKVLAGKPAA